MIVRYTRMLLNLYLKALIFRRLYIFGNSMAKFNFAKTIFAKMYEEI